MKPLRRRLLLRFVTAFVSLAVSLAGAEWFLAVFYGDRILPYRLRLYDPQVTASREDTERDRKTNEYLADENYIEYGDRIPLEVAKNFHGSYNNQKVINTDGNGFRYTGVAIDDHVDVLFLGDSFTFGYNVADDETIPSYVQRLASHDRPGVVVANGGYVGGFSFDGAYLAYKYYLARLHPKLVIEGVFPNNDYDDIEEDKWTVVDREGRPVSFTRYNSIYLEDIFRIPVLRESRLAVGLTYSIEKLLFARRVSEGDPPLWDKISTVIAAFAEEARQNGAELVFVFYNEPNGVFAQRMVRTLNWGGQEISLSAYKDALEEKNHRLQDILAANGVRWLDNASLIDTLKSGLLLRQPPPVEPALEQEGHAFAPVFLEGSGDTVLAGPDGMHYSSLTNLYLAQWLYTNVVASRR